MIEMVPNRKLDFFPASFSRAFPLASASSPDIIVDTTSSSSSSAKESTPSAPFPPDRVGESLSSATEETSGAEKQDCTGEIQKAKTSFPRTIYLLF